MGYVIIFNIIIWLFFLWKGKHTFLWLPLIILVSTFIFPLITDVSSDINFVNNTPHKYLNYTLLLYKLVVLTWVLFNNKLSKLYKDYFGVYILIIYFLLLIPFNTEEPGESFRMVLRFAAEFLFLPASYIYFKTYGTKHFKSIFYSVLTLATFYIIYTSVTKLGFDYYGDSLLYYGGFEMFGLYAYAFALPVLLLFFIKRENKSKILNIVLIVTSFIFSVLAFKRTLIGLNLLFILSYFVYTIKSSKGYLQLFVAGSLIVFSAFYFQSEIESRINTRYRVVQDFELEEQNRVLEYIIAFNELILNPSYETLIGRDVFNDQGNFGINNTLGLNVEGRYLHSDYMKILYGGGFIGLFLVFFFFNKTYNLNKTYKLRNNTNIKLNTYTINVILLGLLISFAIDGFNVFFARGWVFYILGYLLAEKSILYSYETK